MNGPLGSDVAATLARSAADEWDALVAVSIIGTDRHPLPTPLAGWDAWATDADPAVSLLDRAAAVVGARRAGVLPAATLPGVGVAPIDPRTVCPPVCAARLQRMLAGEHDQLLAEWFECCTAIDARLPWTVVPSLLLRGRRNASLDLVVRRLAGPRAAWLAAVVPELGVRVALAPAAAAALPLRSPARVADSAAVVAGIGGAFDERAATWAAAPGLRTLAGSIDPAWLPALIRYLSSGRFDPQIERTRADLLSFAEFRLSMVNEFCGSPVAPS